MNKHTMAVQVNSTCSYELWVAPERSDRNLKTGRFMKGVTAWNKGKTWDDMHIGKRKRRRMLANLEKGRKKFTRRADNAGRNKKPCVCVDDEGNWCRYSSMAQAGEVNGIASANVRRSCASGGKLRAGGLRWFFEDDKTWTKLIKQ